MNSILVIEDERDLAEIIAFNLKKDGYRPSVIFDGSEAVTTIRSTPPDLILLDLMLPGVMGTEICRILKQNESTRHIPIIMLTAKGEEIDRVVGFEVGADDYLVKPFSMRELLLRVRAVLRRAYPAETSTMRKQLGPLVIDSGECRVTVNGHDVVLTSTEFRLLSTLAERVGRVQSRELLLQEVWGYNYVGDTRTVDTHITRLRGKLGEAGEMIRTVRGFGYRMEA